MFCKNCGQEVSDSMKFCRNCGAEVQMSSNKQPSSEERMHLNNSTNHSNYPPIKTEGTLELKDKTYTPRKKGSNLPIVIISVLLSLLILAGGAVVAYKFLSTDEDGEREKNDKEEVSQNFDNGSIRDDKELEDDDVKIHHSEKEEETSSTAERQEKLTEEMEAFLNQSIESLGSHDSVSIAVFDNKENALYASLGANERYSAWGFYLPIYLAYKDGVVSPDNSLLSGVMSNDATVCNQSGNKIIQNMGGTSSISDYIRDEYDVTVTSYGRLFAQMNASADNFTNAREAITFLRLLYEARESTKLSYSLAKFGISAPLNATVYAQIGTENNAVRKNLNFFGIVKGENSDYCIAVLTKNSQGEHISALLQTIHTEMERIAA